MTNEEAKSSPGEILIDVRDRYIDLGISLERSGKIPEAIKAFEQAAHLDPASDNAWIGLGTTLNDAGEYSQAERAFRRALEATNSADKNLAAVLSNLGIALYHQDRFTEAVGYLRKAISLLGDGPAEIYTLLGDCLCQSENQEEALQAYEQAISLNDRLTRAWQGRGEVLGSLGRFEESLKSFDSALLLEPDDPWILSGKAQVLCLSGHCAEAIPVLDAALEI